MDKKQAYERVTAEYERRAAADRRLTALRDKLGAETVTLKDAHNYVDRSAELFGQVFGRTVLDIAQGEREGTCTALMRDRVSDIDEVSESVQSAVLARQGLNISPKSEAYPEKRIFTLAHSLEDPTATEEQITRRAESASATVMRSRFDENMKKGAKTCAAAGLKTYIIRDSASGCCKWCDEVAGKFVYGSEPKDVYRRHDNCSCSVVYESGRGRQNVWSKQYWSAEQEREYLRLRDEMAPKRLNARQAQALRERVGGLTFGTQNGIIIPKPSLVISMQHFAKGHKAARFPDTEEGRKEKRTLDSEIMTYYDHKYRDQTIFEMEMPTDNGYYRYKILNKGNYEWVVLSRRKSKK